MYDKRSLTFASSTCLAGVLLCIAGESTAFATKLPSWAAVGDERCEMPQVLCFGPDKINGQVQRVPFFSVDPIVELPAGLIVPVGRQSTLGEYLGDNLPRASFSAGARLSLKGYVSVGAAYFNPLFEADAPEIVNKQTQYSYAATQIGAASPALVIGFLYDVAAVQVMGLRINNKADGSGDPYYRRGQAVSRAVAVGLTIQPFSLATSLGIIVSKPTEPPAAATAVDVANPGLGEGGTTTSGGAAPPPPPPTAPPVPPPALPAPPTPDPIETGGKGDG